MRECGTDERIRAEIETATAALAFNGICHVFLDELHQTGFYKDDEHTRESILSEGKKALKRVLATLLRDKYDFDLLCLFERARDDILRFFNKKWEGQSHSYLNPLELEELWHWMKMKKNDATKGMTKLRLVNRLIKSVESIQSQKKKIKKEEALLVIEFFCIMVALLNTNQKTLVPSIVVSLK